MRRFLKESETNTSKLTGQEVEFLTRLNKGLYADPNQKLASSLVHRLDSDLEDINYSQDQSYESGPDGNRSSTYIPTEQRLLSRKSFLRVAGATLYGKPIVEDTPQKAYVVTDERQSPAKAARQSHGPMMKRASSRDPQAAPVAAKLNEGEEPSVS